MCRVVLTEECARLSSGCLDASSCYAAVGPLSRKLIRVAIAKRLSCLADVSFLGLRARIVQSSWRGPCECVWRYPVLILFAVIPYLQTRLPGVQPETFSRRSPLGLCFFSFEFSFCRLLQCQLDGHVVSDNHSRTQVCVYPPKNLSLIRSEHDVPEANFFSAQIQNSLWLSIFFPQSLRCHSSLQ